MRKSLPARAAIGAVAIAVAASMAGCVTNEELGNPDGWKKIMEDERMKPEGDMPFNGQRMFWGGFEPILDANKAELARA